MSSALACPVCSTPVPPELANGADLRPCLACNTPLLVRSYPALTRSAAVGSAGARITDAGQASCFYHPQTAAHVPCEGCGRFICALCDVELQGRHLCPACIETGVRKGGLTTFETRRVLWDSIALWTAILPALVCGWVSVVTAPAAIALAVIGWRKPRSLVPRRTTARFVAAIVCALLSLAGITALLFYLINNA